MVSRYGIPCAASMQGSPNRCDPWDFLWASITGTNLVCDNLTYVCVCVHAFLRSFFYIAISIYIYVYTSRCTHPYVHACSYALTVDAKLPWLWVVEPSPARQGLSRTLGAAVCHLRRLGDRPARMTSEPMCFVGRFHGLWLKYT